MAFDSITFFIFFAIFFVGYHLVARRLWLQNLFALVGSCVFYAWWNWRFLGLLLCSAGIDYVAGLLLGADRPARARRGILMVSMVANLGILFAFKYFDFFATSSVAVLAAIGIRASPHLLRVVLPVGISFYTFQSMSYTIDVYRRQLLPERDPVVYFTFVSFFPHMVAGPIQRAHHLITQLKRPRVLRAGHVREAIWLLVWGYFLKTVISDNAAAFADYAFTDRQKSGWTTVLGTIAFGLQIYCDFNAYSLIARGTGRLLGIEFIWNFNLPYTATSVQDFWRRWHISLSTWLRDYLYITLGGSRRGNGRTYVNLLVTMLLGGLWHGAAWNFVLWGLLHGVALALERAYRTVRADRWAPMPAALGWLSTMIVVFSGWFLFRCRSWTMVTTMVRSLANLEWGAHHARVLLSLCALAAPLVAVETWQRTESDLLAPLSLGRFRFALLSGSLIAVVFSMFERFKYAFIYFQF